MSLDPLLAVGTVFLLAGAVKGVTGMGLPTVAIALLGLTMAPAAAAALLVLPSIATNLAQSLGPHARSLTRRLWALWLGLAVATVTSPLAVSADGARLGLGLVLVGYGAWGLGGARLPDLTARVVPAGAVAGLLTGLLTAVTGVFVMPMVPFLQSLRLERDELVQALGLSFMVATLALAVRLGVHGTGTPSMSPATHGVALAAALAGLYVGAGLRRRLRAVGFQRAVFGVFTVLGVFMLYRSV